MIPSYVDILSGNGMVIFVISRGIILEDTAHNKSKNLFSKRIKV